MIGEYGDNAAKYSFGYISGFVTELFQFPAGVGNLWPVG